MSMTVLMSFKLYVAHEAVAWKPVKPLADCFDHELVVTHITHTLSAFIS